MSDRNVIDLSAASLPKVDTRITVPAYDRAALAGGIVHIGVGGFHRAHQAVYLDDLAAAGPTDWAIVGAGVLPGDRAMAEALESQNCLYTLVTRDSETTEVRIVGSIVDYMLAHPFVDDLVDRIADPSTRIVSLTITEGGYPVDDATGKFVPAENGATPPAFAALVRALQRRRTEGGGGFTVMSCDNIMHNGLTARTAVLGAAGLLEPGLDDWIGEHVAFPNAMVDRITPVTTPADIEFLATEYGLSDRWPVVAEPFIQWVLEDSFAAGRPRWEEVGVLMTSDVRPYETLKLRLLNAGHSTLAYLAALAGHVFVHDVVTDPPFRTFLTSFLDTEAAPALPPVPGVDVAQYKEQIVRRFGNTEVRDQVSRLCIDGSSKFPKFLVPTVEAQLDRGGPVRLSALALAAWCQYLLGRDDAGNEIEIAQDPRIDTVTDFAKSSLARPEAFLEYTEVFGHRLGSDPGFSNTFAEALTSLRQHGVHSTLRRWLPEAE